MTTTCNAMNRRAILKAATGTAAVAALGTTVIAQADEAAVEPAEILEADVVIAGAGASGLTAAVEAAENGARVIVLEKAARLGGSCQFAEGVFAAGSSIQKEMGIEGDPKSLLVAEYEFQNYKVNTKLWEQVAFNSAENIDWLIAHGVEFATVAATGGEFATWHVYAGDNHGMMLIDHLNAAAEELGVQILFESPAVSVVMTDGVATGLLASKADGSYLQVNAPSVILATGGFAGNNEMLEQYCNLDMNRVYFRGINDISGDGIRMAFEAGGLEPSNFTACTIGTTVKGIPLTNHITVAGAMDPMQLWVNQDTERFVSEDVAKHYTRATNCVLMQDEVYSFVDTTVLTKLQTEGARFGAGAYVVPGTLLEHIFDDIEEALADGNPDIYKADTFEELAEQMGLDPAKLAQVVATYNAACEAGVDEEYGKDPSSLVALTEPPFYGFRVIANLMNTMGGIRTDIDCRVISAERKPIEGLYAAGMECNGYAGETYGISLPGSDQSIAIATGRVAGARAAMRALA